MKLIHDFTLQDKSQGQRAPPRHVRRTVSKLNTLPPPQLPAIHLSKDRFLEVCFALLFLLAWFLPTHVSLKKKKDHDTEVWRHRRAC